MRHLQYRFIPLLVLLVLFSSCPAFGKVYIDIDSPSFQKFPIAVTEFKPLKPAADKGELPVWFADTLARDLTITGYFQVLDRRAFLEDPKAGITAEATRFEEWTVIGAEYLIKGGFQADRGELITEFRLFDVVRGEMVVGKRYAGKPEDRSRMVTQFVSEVLLALTGEAGLFDTKIAFVRKGETPADIYTINFNGTDLRRITNEKALTLSPRWSPDGRFLAFTSYREGNPDIYLHDLINGATRKLAFYPGLNLPGSWSRDSSRLLVTLSRDGNQEIYVMGSDGSNPTNVSNSPKSIEGLADWSPNGQRMVLYSTRPGNKDVFLMDLATGRWTNLTNDPASDEFSTWSPLQ